MIRGASGQRIAKVGSSQRTPVAKPGWYAGVIWY